MTSAGLALQGSALSEAVAATGIVDPLGAFLMPKRSSLLSGYYGVAASALNIATFLRVATNAFSGQQANL